LGGRWSSLREVMRDVAIAIPFWIVWQAAAGLADAVIGPSNAQSISVLLPIGWLEVSVWIMVSVTAGIVEELVFRGYLQRQLAALSGRISIAVLGQAAVFGLMHAYQGWKAVSVICFLGALFGVVAAWRGSTRPGMIVHAMARSTSPIEQPLRTGEIPPPLLPQPLCASWIRAPSACKALRFCSVVEVTARLHSSCSRDRTLPILYRQSHRLRGPR
jgi:hypothetical protein